MSYLGVPRLHFAGTFLARPSTVNNDITNYDPAQSPLDPGWNPDGDALGLPRLRGHRRVLRRRVFRHGGLG